MKNDAKDILVLCDTEEEYARLMTDFLKSHRDLPWEIHTYTAVKTMLWEERKTEIAILLVAESAYTEELKALRPERMVILNESGVMKWDKMQHINKYQQADNVLKNLLEIYMEIADSQLPRLAVGCCTKFIGIYSPVHRCLQTTFALTMSQMLAEEKHTLYLNFEHYAGITGLLPDRQTRDLADMLYFLNAEKDKFRLRIQTMIQQKGKLDYVPPMKSGQNLLTVTVGEWMQLLQKIAELGEYEYVILDLSESMQGLFDILRICSKVFTLTQTDRIAQSKVTQYEQILALYEYEDVLGKTCKCSLPKIRKIPQELEQYTKGELAEYVQLKRELGQKVRERLDYGRDFTDEEVETVIDDVLLEQDNIVLFPVELRRRMKKELFDSLRRLDILQIFVEDSSVTEIMINGMEHIFVERKGRLRELDVGFESMEKLQDVIQQIVAGCNRVVNEASPIVDARLPDGSRVNIVMNPVALNGPIVTIRRFPKKPITMEQLIQYHSISVEAAEFLKKLVQAGYNIFISGGTGSGKTTFLNVLSDFIPTEERVITIEDSAELQLQGLPNLVRLETRNSNVEGCREITVRELIRCSLRMRPTRIIVGEVRGAEAIDMLQCLNTGHDGSMSTGHANSGIDMLARLENMVLMGMDIPVQAIRQQIASGIDIVVHLGRLRDKSRRVLEITEITGYQENQIRLNPLFAFEEEGEDGDGNVVGRLRKKGALLHESKLKAAGLS